MKKKTAILLSIIMLLVIFSCNSNKDSKDTKNTTETLEKKTETKEKTIFVYSGAGLKKPVSEIGELFEKEYGVKVEFSYAGSGQLLTQLETTGKGDVYIVGSVPNYEAAKKKNLVGEYITVAHHTPAIIVLKGNPKNILSLEDLSKSGIKVILGDEKASAIGKTSQEILEKNKLEKVNNNVISKAATVNEMVLQLTTGQADAMIATIDSVYDNDKLEIIKIYPEKNIDQIISGGIVEKSDKKDLAKQFLDFAASERGKEIFKKYGFEPVK